MSKRDDYGMLKNVIFMIVLYMIALSAGYALGLLIRVQFKPRVVNIGDVYIGHCTDFENPFIENSCDTLLVLDVKSGYVKYMERNGRYYGSCKESTFLYDKEIISDE